MFTVGTVVMTYFKQDKMLYVPAVPNENYKYPDSLPHGYRNPGESGLFYENIYIMTRDKIKLHAWWVKANSNPKLCRTLIFFHENAGNIGTRIPNIDILVKRLNCNVFIVAYRGYSYSEGTPSEDGLKLDAEATLEHVCGRDDLDTDRVYIFGRSLGGAVAIQLAENHSNKMKGVIIENTFTSIGDMVDHLMPLVAIFRKFIQRIFWPSIDRIGNVTAPLCMIRGMKDEIVPCSHSKTLYDAASKSKFKVFHEFPEGDHNSTWKIGGETYIKYLKEFFDKCERDD